MIESLFFSCHKAFLLGDFEQTKLYYELLREEFKVYGQPDSLKKHQLSDLKRIKDSLDSGSVPKNVWADISGYVPMPKPETDIKQAELVQMIDAGAGQLREILQDDLQLYNIEQPCSPYGRVDMVYMGTDTIYPLEVKKDQGRHDLVGQIGKYDLYHRLRLHYKHYEHVQSLTVCASYDPPVLNMLKQLGIKTFLYAITNSDIHLSLL
jgi:hypothetical protein